MTEQTENPETPEEPTLDEAQLADGEAPKADAEADAETEDAGPDLAEEALRYKDQLLRALAEVENTKKRALRDVKEAREYAVTGFARDMLDVADNLSRALGSLDDQTKADAGPALTTLLEGVELTEKRLASTLERHGVKRIDPEAGEPLDPNRHQAAAQIPADQPKGTIAHVMQPGYVIGERTLRAAMVVVSAGPAEGSKPDSDAGGVDVSA